MDTREPVVYVVDDDPSFLRGVSRLLSAAGLTIGAFRSAEDFLAAHDPREPGCLVLDLAMPGLTGLELQEALEASGCERPIVFLSGRGDIPSSVQAMKHGAVDFLTKPVDEDVLLAAIDAALERDAIRRQDRGEVIDFRRRWATLTPRESEVAQRVIAGRLNKQIATEMGIVERTVKYHRNHVMSKLDVRSVAELARLAALADLTPDG
ncbi:MAG: response regulator [Gemmatimonadota bacterium]|nr:response regulator [Gemmatimonadota bacterium]